MITAEQMKLVFRLDAVGFSLPVDHLVEVCQGSSGWLHREPAEGDPGRLGTIQQRDRVLDVYDLGRRLGLAAWAGDETMNLVVLTGRSGAWALPVDEIVGIFPGDQFRPLQTSPLLDQVSRLPQPVFELWQDEVLICGDAGEWGQIRD